MDKKFSIKLFSSSKDRPQISKEVTEYFEDFFTDNILTKYKIILNGKSNVWVAVLFMAQQKFGPNQISVFKPTSTAEENVKSYTVEVPLQWILDDNYPYQKTLELIFDAIKEFFLANFKKVEPGYFHELKTQVEWEKLLSLPYPASLRDQNYVGGNNIILK